MIDFARPELKEEFVIELMYVSVEFGGRCPGLHSFFDEIPGLQLAAICTT